MEALIGIMTQRTLTFDEAAGFFRRLFDYGPVMGPHERHRQQGSYHFGWLQGPEELVLDYTSTTLPPKKAFFPPRQMLFEFTLTDPPEFESKFDTAPFTLVGAHPCDLQALDQLDAAYGAEPAEACWSANRARARVIGVDCMPDHYCFCTSLATNEARGSCDLFLTSIERGYLVEVRTATGQEMLADCASEDPSADDVEDAKRWREEKAERVTASLDAPVDQLADILEADGLGEVWHEIAERCYSCGSCNTTCPNCFCFDVKDEFAIGLGSGTRVRTWDSCQLRDFAIVAGGHNFRRLRWERVRHRWQRKFLYLYRKFGTPYCTGCGRCSRACTADINMVDVSNQLINHAARKG